MRTTITHAPSFVPAALGEYSGAAGAVAASLRRVYAKLGIDRADLGDLPTAGELTANTIASFKARHAET